MQVQRISQNTEKPKSTIGRKIGAFTGAGISTYATLNFIDEFKSTTKLNSAKFAFDSLHDSLKQTMDFGKFAKNYIKRANILSVAQYVAGIATIMTAAVGVGFIVDKIIEATKRHKANKKPVVIINIQQPQQPQKTEQADNKEDTIQK